MTRRPAAAAATFALPRSRRARRATRDRIGRVAIVGTVLAAMGAVALASCSHTNSGLGRLTVDGQAQVTRPYGAPRPAHSGQVLYAGDRVQVTAGQAAVRLMPDGVVQLRNGAQVVVDKTLRLTSGAILIQPIGHELKVSALDATLVVPSGVAQLAVGTAEASLTAKVYQATAHLDIAGNPPAPVTAPRQISLTPMTRLPVQASPLQYQDSDPWDHQYLAAAETISAQLGAAATGFNGQVPANQGKDAAFYQHLVPSLNGRPDFVSAFDVVQGQQPIGSAPAAKPGDYLIASVIALRGTHGSLVNRLGDELVFFAQGAPWGFVAYDQDVTDLTALINDVLAAIGRAELPFTRAPASQIAIGPPPTSPPTTRPSHQPTSRPTITTTPPHPPPTTTTIPLPTIHLPPPVRPGLLGSILNPLLDPLIQALNNILAGKG